MRKTVLACCLALGAAPAWAAGAPTQPPSVSIGAPRPSSPPAIQVAPPPKVVSSTPAVLPVPDSTHTLLRQIPVPEHLDSNGPFDPGPPGPALTPLPYPQAIAPPMMAAPTPPAHMGTLHEAVTLLRYIDPDIPNVTCYLTGPIVRGPLVQQVASGAAVPLIGLSCGASGPVHLPPTLQVHKELFVSPNASLWLDRIVDANQGSIVYTVISKQTVNGLNLSAVSAIWITQAGL